MNTTGRRPDTGRRLDVVDLYAGAGGWDEGAKTLGLRTVGLELFDDPCRTGLAAGHARIRCDVATYPTQPFGGLAGLIASPPCQAWSMAGKRDGERDRAEVHRLVDAYATDSVAGPAETWTAWADARSHHAAQPVRWVRDLRPDWVCLEQVPPVLDLWEHIAVVFGRWGYSMWAGLLNAAHYGVPQTRVRAFLIASRSRAAVPPPATHYDPRPGMGLFGTPWVSMAEALGWGNAARPAPVVTSGGTGSGGGVEVFAGKHAREVAYRNGSRERAAVRPLTAPAPTVMFGESANEVTWELTSPHRAKTNDRTRPRSMDQPAHTVAFGHSDMRWTQPAEAGETQSVRVTVEEAAALQGFRPDYPWRGSRTSQYTQVGNAVPPAVAAAVLGQVSPIVY